MSKTQSKLRGIVGDGFESNRQDVMNVKQMFSKLGMYDGDTEQGLIDRKLDNTIRGFQRSQGLRVDGWMAPGGETERMLQRVMSGGEAPMPERLNLRDGVGGSNQSNHSQDVSAVQKALSFLGYAAPVKQYEPNGIIDVDTVDGIRKFQRSNDLRVDGWMAPGGETEASVNYALFTKKKGGKGKTEKSPKRDCSGFEQALEMAKARCEEREQELENARKDLKESQGKETEILKQIAKEQEDWDKAAKSGGDIGKEIGDLGGEVAGAYIGSKIRLPNKIRNTIIGVAVPKVIEKISGYTVGEITRGIGEKAGNIAEEAGDYFTDDKSTFTLLNELKTQGEISDELFRKVIKLEAELAKLKQQETAAAKALDTCQFGK